MEIKKDIWKELDNIAEQERMSNEYNGNFLSDINLNNLKYQLKDAEAIELNFDLTEGYSYKESLEYFIGKIFKIVEHTYTLKEHIIMVVDNNLNEKLNFSESFILSNNLSFDGITQFPIKKDESGYLQYKNSPTIIKVINSKNMEDNTIIIYSSEHLTSPVKIKLITKEAEDKKEKIIQNNDNLNDDVTNQLEIKTDEENAISQSTDNSIDEILEEQKEVDELIQEAICNQNDKRKMFITKEVITNLKSKLPKSPNFIINEYLPIDYLWLEVANKLIMGLKHFILESFENYEDITIICGEKFKGLLISHYFELPDDNEFKDKIAKLKLSEINEFAMVINSKLIQDDEIIIYNDKQIFYGNIINEEVKKPFTIYN